MRSTDWERIWEAVNEILNYILSKTNLNAGNTTIATPYIARYSL